jgi:nitrite reductase/ring-hydroxylating ferredoxin subunit
MRIEGVKAPEPGRALRVSAEGSVIAVFNVGGSLFAIDSRCTHVGAPLEEGTVEGTGVICPWHGSQFDLASGRVLRGPAARPVRAYAVRVDGTALVLEAKTP